MFPVLAVFPVIGVIAERSNRNKNQQLVPLPAACTTSHGHMVRVVKGIPDLEHSMAWGRLRLTIAFVCGPFYSSSGEEESNKLNNSEKRRENMMRLFISLGRTWQHSLAAVAV